jgi:hypothetical protein
MSPQSITYTHSSESEKRDHDDSGDLELKRPQERKNMFT